MKINLNKMNLYVKQGKLKDLKELGFYEERVISIQANKISAYYLRFDLNKNSYVMIHDSGMIDFSAVNINDSDCMYNISKLIFELTRRDFLQNRRK